MVVIFWGIFKEIKMLYHRCRVSVFSYMLYSDYVYVEEEEECHKDALCTFYG